MGRDSGRTWRVRVAPVLTGAGAACAGVERPGGGRVLKGAAAQDPGFPGVEASGDREVAREFLISLSRVGTGNGPPGPWSPVGGPALRPSVEAHLPFSRPRRYGSRRLSQALEESQPVAGARVGKEKEEEQ